MDMEDARPEGCGLLSSQQNAVVLHSGDSDSERMRPHARCHCHAQCFGDTLDGRSCDDTWDWDPSQKYSAYICKAVCPTHRQHTTVTAGRRRWPGDNGSLHDILIFDVPSMATCFKGLCDRWQGHTTSHSVCDALRCPSKLERERCKVNAFLFVSTDMKSPLRSPVSIHAM
jgi:hypothetical protein